MKFVLRETNYLQYQWLSYKKDMAVPKPVQDFLNKQYREMKMREVNCVKLKKQQKALKEYPIQAN